MFTQFLEKNLAILCFLFSILGLVVPGGEYIPLLSVKILVGTVIGLSAFKFDLKDLNRENISRGFGFYLIRFVLFPAVFYLIAKFLVPQYAIALLIFSLLPAGVSTPSLILFVDGNVSLGFSLVLLSTLLCPVVMPLMLYLSGYTDIALPLMDLFLGLLVTVFVPCFIALICKRYQRIESAVESYRKLVTLVIIILLGFVPIAMQQQLILNALSSSGMQIFLSSFVFFLFFQLGLSVSRKYNKKDLLATTICSTANNTALGIAITLGIIPQAATFLILAEFPWTVLPGLLLRWGRGKLDSRLRDDFS